MQKLARKPVRQAIEEFWKRFGALGTPKAFQAYKRVGGATLVGVPLIYGGSKLHSAYKYMRDVDPDQPDYELALHPHSTGMTMRRMAGIAPFGYAPERVHERYKQNLQDLISAPSKEPGEQVVTASAQDFLEKRAALQGMEKEAFGALKRLFSPAARAAHRATRMGINPADIQQIRGISSASRTSAGAVDRALKAGITDVGQLQNIAQQAVAAAPSAGLGSKLLGPGGLLLGTGLLGAGALADPIAQRLGFEFREMPEAYRGITGLPARVRMDELAAESFANSVGKELGKATVGLAGDLLSKTIDIPGSIAGGVQRRSVLSELQAEDEVLAKADPAQVDEAYHTMVRFAPTLATDKNAVKTFLRESVLYGTGPNFTTIKQLADAEGAVNRPPAVVVKR
jgi:hypothetical protein